MYAFDKKGVILSRAQCEDVCSADPGTGLVQPHGMRNALRLMTLVALVSEREPHAKC